MESWLRVIDDIDDLVALATCAAPPVTGLVVVLCIALLWVGTLIAGAAGFAAAAIGCGALLATIPMLGARGG